MAHKHGAMDLAAKKKFIDVYVTALFLAVFVYIMVVAIFFAVHNIPKDRVIDLSELFEFDDKAKPLVFFLAVVIATSSGLLAFVPFALYAKKYMLKEPKIVDHTNTKED